MITNIQRISYTKESNSAIIETDLGKYFIPDWIIDRYFMPFYKDSIIKRISDMDIYTQDVYIQKIDKQALLNIISKDCKIVHNRYRRAMIDMTNDYLCAEINCLCCANVDKWVQDCNLPPH